MAGRKLPIFHGHMPSPEFVCPTKAIEYGKPTVHDDVRARSRVRDCMDCDPTEILDMLVRHFTTLASFNEYSDSCTEAYWLGY